MIYIEELDKIYKEKVTGNQVRSREKEQSLVKKLFLNSLGQKNKNKRKS